MLQSCLNEKGIVLPRCTYSAWQRELGKYGVLAKRAHLAWEKIEKFCQREHPLIMRSLRQVAIHQDIPPWPSINMCFLSLCEISIFETAANIIGHRWSSLMQKTHAL